MQRHNSLIRGDDKVILATLYLARISNKIARRKERWSFLKVEKDLEEIIDSNGSERSADSLRPDSPSDYIRKFPHTIISHPSRCHR